jgi:hypothetical protein
MSDPVDGEPIRTEAPYPPSWIDRLTAWISRLPGPIWLFYVLSVLVLMVLLNVLFWIDGSVPAGTFIPDNNIFAVFIVYWLGLYQHLTHVGTKSLKRFSELLDADEAEIAKIEYELATLPRWLGWIAIPLGLGLAVSDIASDPNPYGDLVVHSSIIVVGDYVTTSLLAAMFFCVVIRSIRQLRMVDRLHSRATHLNLLDLGPAHAFSNLTARTGVGLILLLVLAYLFEPTSASTPIDLLLYVAIVVLAIAVFVLPLIGIRTQLNAEKDRVLKDTSDRLKDAWDAVGMDTQVGDLDGLKGLEIKSNTLIRKRELLSKISTWPWNPRTLRGFASTLLLPIFLWLVTRFLERFL